MTIWVKFYRNRPSRLGCRAVTDRHTNTQTHRQPGSILTYSVKMTEYENKNQGEKSKLPK